MLLLVATNFKIMACVVCGCLFMNVRFSEIVTDSGNDHLKGLAVYQM